MKCLGRGFLILLLTVGALVGCDPTYYVDVYFENSTSQTVIVRAIRKENADSVDFVNHKYDSILIKSGKRILLNQYNDMGYFMREGVPDQMSYLYPYGMIIEYENGTSVTYYPDSADTDFHSPYQYKSFFYHEMEEYNEAFYVILY